MSIETIKALYESGCWGEGELSELVSAGLLTQEQYNSIVGQAASENQSILEYDPSTSLL